MTISKNICDREYDKFSECNNRTVVETHLCQEAGETVKVEFAQSGVVTNLFNQITNVASGSPTNIISYTVPVGRTFKIDNIQASGNNRAKYTVEINSVDESIKRTYQPIFNVDFSFYGLELVAGDIVNLIVEHNRTAINEFDGRIIGRLT